MYIYTCFVFIRVYIFLLSVRVYRKQLAPYGCKNWIGQIGKLWNLKIFRSTEFYSRQYIHFLPNNFLETKLNTEER